MSSDVMLTGGYLDDLGSGCEVLGGAEEEEFGAGEEGPSSVKGGGEEERRDGR